MFCLFSLLTLVAAMRFPPLHDGYRLLASTDVLFPQTKVETQDESNDAQDKNDNEEAPPLQLPGTASRSNALVKVDVACLCVVLYVFRVLFCLLHHGFLDDDGFGEIFKQLVEFEQSALDLLNVVVTSADGAKDGRGGGCAVRLELWEMVSRVCTRQQKPHNVRTAVWKTPSLPQSALAAS